VETRLGWFGVRGATAKRVVEELRSACVLAARQDIPIEFRLCEQPGRTRAQSWTLVLLEAGGAGGPAKANRAAHWAQALSFRFLRPAIAFEPSGGQWVWSMFDAGREILVQEPGPALFGDRAHAAELFGVEAALFDTRSQALEEHRAGRRPGDIFAAADFARHLGLRFPQEGDAFVRYAPSPADVELAGAAWRVSLPSRSS